MCIHFEKRYLKSWTVSKTTLFRKTTLLFINIFDFVSLCDPLDELEATQTTTWIENHVAIYLSKSSNLINESIFLHNKNSQKLIVDFVINLELLAEKSKHEMRTKFRDFERLGMSGCQKLFRTD